MTQMKNDDTENDGNLLMGTTGGGRKLIIRVVVLTLLIVVSGIFIGQYDTHSGDDNYLAAVLEKDRLIRNTASPKIILVGGSNLAFGIDSRAIEDSLGIHVVNMGCTRGLGCGTCSPR